LHKYSLHAFNIIENFASEQDLYRLKKPFSVRLKSPFKLIKETLNREVSIIPIKERFIDFDPEILNLTDNVYLEGYWQSEKYFKDIEEIIRTEFRIKIPPDPLTKQIGDEIISHESVSIHVRRGDYVSNPKTNQIHGVCDIPYYQKAIDEMCNKIDSPHFYVFSDDPQWVKTNITTPNAPIDFVTHNDASKNYDDLRLMSLCKHHIIANSSFSWWGAWLGKKKGQIVIAPSRWYNTKKSNYSDKLPTYWNTVLLD
jgi:hypothetical protein